MRRPKTRNFRHQHRQSKQEEVQFLNSWIEAQKPDSGTNPLSLPPLPPDEPIGRVHGDSFSRYSGVTEFNQLPLSKKTKDGLKASGFIKMTDIQRASLPHSLCGRDILGAAKTGSGKTLAFIVPVLEKLYKERWGPEDGVGCIILSPTRELAVQLFDVLKVVGKYHNFSAGLLIGGRDDVDTEKEHVNTLNILVCTPGRLLQHMDETPNFDCSNLQVLVLDEADRILDVGFKKTLNAIISQLPTQRQTFLFSATQTKSVQDLARLSLKDPEYLSVHEESVTVTPSRLQQIAMVVPLDQKLDMLWSFIKTHKKFKILVFLSSCKQVKFVFEAFKQMKPGIALKCLHGRMKQGKRVAIYSRFCETRSVLFSTDVAARGLDFNKAVDWVVQVDCPEDVASYIHRVGRTARYDSGGKSVLFVMPSEMKMFEKLKEARVPICITKVNASRVQPISHCLPALLAEHPHLQPLAQRAFITYLKSIHIQKDKEIFNVTKLPVDEFSASLGLPMTPKIRFVNQKIKKNVESQISSSPGPVNHEIPREKLDIGDVEEPNILMEKDAQNEVGCQTSEVGQIDLMPGTRVLKKKKLKINIHRPAGTRVVFDEEGKALPPLARIADINVGKDQAVLDQEKKEEYYKKMREEMKKVDKEDKLLEHQRRKEKRMKDKFKQKGRDMEEYDEDLPGSGLVEETKERPKKKTKIYFNNDDDDDSERKEVNNKVIDTDSITLAEQEALALNLLNSMHS